jgi:hypothetical protein
VADGPGGLKVLDLSDPSQPARLSAMQTLEAWDLVGRESMLFLADGRGGFLTVDASDPSAPVPLGRLPSPDARAVALCGSLVLLADAEQGLKVIDVSRPAEPKYVAHTACAAWWTWPAAGSWPLSPAKGSRWWTCPIRAIPFEPARSPEAGSARWRRGRIARSSSMSGA